RALPVQAGPGGARLGPDVCAAARVATFPSRIACCMTREGAVTISPILSMSAGQPIVQKVEALQRFLGEQYFHASGIMYSQWRMTDSELRPFRAEDFADQSVTRTSAGFSRAGYASSENSPWVSGLFLWSQCLRY